MTALAPVAVRGALGRKPPRHAAVTTGPPDSVADVGRNMRLMDKTQGTAFEAWVRSEKNIAYICSFKRWLFDDALAHDPQRLVYVLKWMMDGWSVASCAELILKLFYSLRIESPDFGRLLAALTDDWPVGETADLVNVLLVGESAHTAVALIRHMTNQGGAGERLSGIKVQVDRAWTTSERVELVKQISEELRWRHSYLQSFLMDYAASCITDTVRQRALVMTVCQEFEELQAIASFSRIVRSASGLGMASTRVVPVKRATSPAQRRTDPGLTGDSAGDSGKPGAPQVEASPMTDGASSSAALELLPMQRGASAGSRASSDSMDATDTSLNDRVSLFVSLFEIVQAEIDLEELEAAVAQLGHGELVGTISEALLRRIDSKLDVDSGSDRCTDNSE
ncbi:hypothetical protein HK105_201162 [Polyrhizophydium stewartii]|uniref:Uncharacterized protein n=1 Tax=Polyrhizophydium stewartii TaxID=2732419 RepID=A0ABR4NJ74_9FUNG|nr:hypothetical protein HK105_001278 [Polyrhizophydium stewartii]